MMVSYMKRVLCLEYPPSCSSAPMPTSKTYVNEKENTNIIVLLSKFSLPCVTEESSFALHERSQEGSAEITFALLV